MGDTDARQPSRAGWQRAALLITRIEIGIGAIALILILVMVFLQAVQRYLPLESAAWTGELARFSLIWVTFAAAGVLVTTNGHIALELVDAAPNRNVVRWVQVFALVVVAATGVGLAIEAIALVESQGVIKSPVLRVPMSFVYLPVLIGVISTVIRAAVTAFLIAKNGPMITEYDRDETPEVTA